MVRTFWLGFVFLIAIGGLIAYKTSFAIPAARQTASVDAPAALADTQHIPLAKADRLDVNYLDDVPDKTPIRTIPINLSEPAEARPEKVTKIISRHWHVGYGRMRKRSARLLRFASRSKRPK
jgi:hypothetical protein